MGLTGKFVSLYDLKRWVLILASTAALLAFQAEGQAQSFKEWGLKLWDKMMQPDKNLDSTYVFQPFKGWNFSTTYKARWDKIGIDAPAEFSVIDAGKVDFLVRFNLVEDVTHHVGLGAGYGPISLGYSVAVGRTNKKDRHFSFDWTDTRFAVQLHHSKIHDIGECTIEKEGSEPTGIQGIPTTATLWRVSGFYIFNHKKFSYPSAYTGKLVQRKSAGSFLVGAKYLHGNITLPENSTVVSNLVLDLIGYTTNQVSLGAGYSFNWVLYHRDANTRKDIRSLRNLTFNVTAIPLLTFVNEMRMTHLTTTGDKEVVPIHGHFQPNVLGKVGLCYAIGHFYLNCGFEYNYNIFRTGQLSNNDLSPNAKYEIPYRYKLTIIGHLANCVGSLELHYRF